MKSYNGKMKTDLDFKVIPEVFHYICLLMILIYSALKKDGKYYPQEFSEECKYIIKEKKKQRYIKKS